MAGDELLGPSVGLSFCFGILQAPFGARCATEVLSRLTRNAFLAPTLDTILFYFRNSIVV